MSIILTKELRAGRVVDYFSILFVAVVTLYSNVHIFIPLLLLLIPDRFTFPLWERDDERIFFCVMGENNIKEYRTAKKALLIFESNIIFIIGLIFFLEDTFVLSLIDFNCYLLFFLAISEYLFTLISPVKKNQRLLLLSSLSFASIVFSIILLFIETLIYPILSGIYTLIILIWLNILSSRHFYKQVNLKRFLFS